MRRCILAIDDSKAIRFLLHTVLGKEYQVVTAPDACSAMYWLANRNLPDLIIADPQLPDVQDWELIAEFSSSAIYRDIPLIVLSSLDKNVTAAQCLKFGIAHHYTKPFNPLELHEMVQKLMNKVASKLNENEMKAG
ncbi:MULTISPECIES: response regulator [Niastella]|uniref:Response regulator n=1 Tax=Niastella soli TaxID=2821487 RepID=A0ABS3YM39_9BACT|nr:response regulator [Niastella soli]MBO9198967.1 response regulator [Niastella soli]